MDAYALISGQMRALKLLAVFKKRKEKFPFKDALVQQTGFHLRSSMRETKDLPISKRADESFLARGDIRFAKPFPIPLIRLSIPLWLLKPWGVWVWPQRSEVACFTPGHTKPTQ